MKRLRLDKNSTKQGVASLYVVIFATILFGVITVSFTRIILSEATQTSNDDLSQSAYDAALAGVQDAKTAVNQYYDCVAKGGNCDTKNVFSNGDGSQNICEKEGGFPLARVLYNGHEGEVKIQESNQSGSGMDSDTYADQAYTCVIISDITSDYRSTLSSDTRTRVIPLGANSANGATTQLGKVKTVEFSWYSELNQGSNDGSSFNLSDGKTLNNSSDKTVPPTIQLTFIKTGSEINLDYFNNSNNIEDVIDSTMLLLPSGSDTKVTTISRDSLVDYGNVTKNGSNDPNEPVGVNCRSDRDFACKVQLKMSNETSSLLNDGDNAFLVVSLPYGDAYTDFAVTLLDARNQAINFHGAQISVDSTGRTNQLFRRVESRLDPSDLFFPYPQFELDLGSGDGESIQKNIWATNNCWKSSITNGVFTAETCDNNSTLNLDNK